MRLLNKLKLNRRHLLACICSLLLLVGVTSAAVFAIILRAENSEKITVTYSAGGIDTDYNGSVETETYAFDSITKEPKDKSASGCLVLHGEKFADVVTSLNPKLQAAIDGKPNGARSIKVDDETFFFRITKNGDGTVNFEQIYNDGRDVAYSFTGWHIKNAVDANQNPIKIPGETVFQPGDTIDPTVLEQYADDGTLELEALWGKCYFVGNKYATMVYDKDKTDEKGHMVVLSGEGALDYSDDYKGNRPWLANVSIDTAFEKIRQDNGYNSNNQDTVATTNTNSRSYDAYSCVVMLARDVDYIKHDQESSKYFGYDIKQTENMTDMVYTSATFKSQGNACYKINYKPKGYGCTTLCNLRFDNVKMCKANIEGIITGQEVTNTFGLDFDKNHYDASVNGKTQDPYRFYFEVTAREGSTGVSDGKTMDEMTNVLTELSNISALYSIDADKHTTIVLNGATINYLSLNWDFHDGSDGYEYYLGKTRHWYVGREAFVQRVAAANTSTHANNVHENFVPFNIVVTGGRIRSLRTAGDGVNSICTGNRNIKVYGDGEANGTSTTHDPEIMFLYGGGNRGRLFGDITMLVDHCTKINEVYGGGYENSATVYGNVEMTIANSIVARNVYGGGELASLEKISDTYLQYREELDGSIAAEPVEISSLHAYSTYASQWSDTNYGGDVTINLDNSHIKGTVYGTGKGASRTASVTEKINTKNNPEQWDQNGNANWYSGSNAWVPKHFKETPSGFPKYNEADGRVLVGQAYNYVWSANTRDTLIAYTYNTYAYLGLSTVENVTINVTGGTLEKNIYGGGDLAKVYGDTNITISGGTVKGDVYGGGKAADMTQTNKEAKVYVIGDGKYGYTQPTYTPNEVTASGPTSVTIPQNPSPYYNESGFPTVIYEWTSEESVKAMGGVDESRKLLYSANLKEVGMVVGDTNVTISGGHVQGNVYGGGNEGTVKGTTGVTVSGGTVTKAVFGGGLKGQVASTSVQVQGGIVTEAVYGGGNQGAVSGNTQLSMSNGTVYCLFGGAKDANIDGNVSVTLSGGTVLGAKNGNDQIIVMDGGGDAGDVYCGNNVGGKIQGTITANATGGKANWFMGGGNLANYDGTTKVTVSGTAQLSYVVGGGFQATVGGTDVQIQGGTVSNDVYGGGLRAGVIGNASVQMSGGTVGKLLGGSRASGDIGGSVTVNVTNGTITELYGGGLNAGYAGTPQVTIAGGTISYVFGGGSQATTGGGNVRISGGTITTAAYGGGLQGDVNGNTDVVLDGGTVANIYGGANQADITGDVTLNITGGTVSDGGRVFGGNDITGSIGGNIAVTVTGGKISNAGGGIYGGGNKADYGGIPIVVINGGTMHNIYGGGFQGAVGGGNVTINNNNHENATKDIGNVFAGGHEGDVNGNTILNIHGGRMTNAYGANRDSGEITGSVEVYIDGGYVAWLYGGGSSAPYDKVPSVTVTGNADVKRVSGGGWKAPVQGTDVFIDGGTINHVYAGGDESDVLGDTKLVIEGTEQKKPVIASYIYGGGNLGNVHGNVDVTIRNATINTTIYNGDSELSRVYGGGNKGYVAGNVSMKILDGVTVGKMVYGGGRNKEVRGNVTLEIAGATLAQGVYGGGYQGEVLGSTHVTIKGGTTIPQSVYGGGENASVNSTYVEINDRNSSGVVNISGSVFGGGQGATATVYESTEVVVDMKYGFTATETPVTVESNEASGQITTTITPEGGPYGKIAGNVYGGGDLGRVGSGIIDLALNRATITQKANTKVTIKNGNIGKSVFGGGNGVPTSGTYEVYMGSVFGTTKTNIFGGYIEGNVYGGGTQSRLFGEDGEAITAHVVINENGNGSQNNIAIKGSVFGGGDRGSEGTTNASVATTVGNAKVEIIGNEAGSKTYFINGGVYGDGNLCMVSGHREIVMTNFKTANSQAGGLKTFYSLQRADKVTLNGSQFVLLGAIDLVEAGDENLYSVNRVNSLDMKSGSTVKFSKTVKYLSAISSDVETDRKFISLGYNGTNNYTAHGYNQNPAINDLTDAEINTYRNSSSLKNTICVANGLFLEVKNLDGSYGPVTGLFTLQLLHANRGEGGGFVYADINESTGDFICMTTKVDSSEYMNVIDTVGGSRTGDRYQYYYWYIDGTLMTYSMNLEAYIGVADTAFQADTYVPHHPGKTLKYVLQSVSESTSHVLSNAITAGTYSLVQTATNLSGNQIAIELKHGDDSLGFLIYDGSHWGIKKGSSTMNGTAVSGTTDSNLLMEKALGYDSNLVSVVLHKSTAIDTEIRGIEFNIAIDLYDGASQYKDGTNAIVLKTTAAILRLYASQSKYAGDSRLYNGVPTDSAVQITEGSSYSVEYQTNYLPSNFAEGTFKWQLTTKGYKYYYNSTNGEYVTADEAGNWTNKSAGYASGSGTPSGLALYDQISERTLPIGTKLTLIDMTNEAAPTYYYYICTEATTTINLDDFIKMGTNTKLSATEPAFKQEYNTKKTESSQVSERLVIVCDFANVELDANFDGELHLQHLYNDVDVMDYIREGTDNYLRSTPKSSKYVINSTATGMATGDAAFTATAGDGGKIPNFGSVAMSVQWQEATDYINSKLSEGRYAVKVELLDGNGNEKKFPEGMYFQCGNVIMKPDGNNKFVAIEVGEHAVKAGDAMGAEFRVFNPYYDLRKYMGTDTVKFRLSLYNSADDSYVKLGSLNLSKEITFTIEDTATYTLKVTCSGNTITRVLKSGDTISPTITTQSTLDTTSTVGVQLAKKINGAYEQVSWDNVFTENVGEIIQGSYTYGWKTKGSAEKGSYRIVFTYGNRIEYLSFIVK